MAVLCVVLLLALAAALAAFVFMMATLPPLSCTPTHGAVQLNCVHGHLAP